jgi:hypothetical protein
LNAASSPNRNGAANTGGGASGTTFTDNATTSSGGSGIIILRVPQTRTVQFTAGVTVSAGSPTSGYIQYTVTAAGINDKVTIS